VFVYELTLSHVGSAEFLLGHGLVPAHVSWISATTSLFVHENLIHVGSNLVSLWIFGDNVEDQLGHGRFLLLYLLAGYAGALAQVWVDPTSLVPIIGASGAVAGVMGAYFVMFPHSRVLMLIPLVVFFDVVEIPAIVLLGVWFFFQVVASFDRVFGEPGGGGAYWAHLGGFLIGVATVKVFRRPERQRVEWWSG
jgi:membrane associated rhomboid family serine protease